MLDKSSIYVLAEGMYFLDKSNPSDCNFLNFPLPLSSFLNLLFHQSFFVMFPLFQKYLNPQLRINSVIYHPCLSGLASMINPFIFLYTPFFKLSLNFNFFTSLQNSCWIFSNLYIPLCVGKSFQFMLFTFLKNALSQCNFTHAPVATQNPR